MKYAFIDEQRGQHSITMLCRVLDVNRGSYYAHHSRGPGKRAQADAELAPQVCAIFARHKQRYGAKRIALDLHDAGVSCSKRRVGHLMRQNNLVAKARKRFKTTTQSDPRDRIVPDLVARRFQAEQPKQLLTGDITYIWTAEGWLYLAIVLDVCTRSIAGWATSSRIDAELVSTAMRRAIGERVFGNGTIFHSDRGSQYCSKMFRAILSKAEIRQSQGLSCYDNAITETFFHTLKIESVYGEHFQTRYDAHRVLFEYINAYYNRVRRHSALGHRSPLQFEHALNHAN